MVDHVRQSKVWSHAALTIFEHTLALTTRDRLFINLSIAHQTSKSKTRRNYTTMEHLKTKPGRRVGDARVDDANTNSTGARDSIHAHPSSSKDRSDHGRVASKSGRGDDVDGSRRPSAPTHAVQSLDPSFRISSSSSKSMPPIPNGSNKFGLSEPSSGNVHEMITPMHILSRFWLMILLIATLPMQVSQLLTHKLTSLYGRVYLICMYQYTNIGLIYGLIGSFYMIKWLIYHQGYLIELLLVLCFGTGLINKKNLAIHSMILVWIMGNIYLSKLMIVSELLIILVLHLNTVQAIMIKMIMQDPPQEMIDKFILMDTKNRIETIANLIGMTRKQLTWIDQCFVFQFDIVLNLRKLPGFNAPWLNLILLLINNSTRFFDGIQFNERIKLIHSTILVQKMSNQELDLRRDAWRQLRNM